jgi:DNA-binding NarL/FixJ family response regulator
MERQEKLLTEVNETLSVYEQKLLRLEERERQHNAFQESLNQAEITTKLQRSRLSSQEYNSQMSPPERYRYVHSLAASGMSSEEIASILSISIHEADQLVNLARLAHSD